jgi:hypothetical protein
MLNAIHMITTKKISMDYTKKNQMFHFKKIYKVRPDMVAHICNPSYSGGRDQEGVSQGK